MKSKKLKRERRKWIEVEKGKTEKGKHENMKIGRNRDERENGK